MKGGCCMKSTLSPVLSVLFISFLLFPCYSAEAAITAVFESPGDAQPVAGITTVSGWAFDTELDSHISRVTLLIDETLRLDIPCCAERGDVQRNFPAFPAEQTLNSGWGTAFNWGVLSAGVHTLRVEIETTSGELFSTQTRTITVVKPGDFAFLDSFDLSAADASIVGTQLVLKGVEVRDKTSKQTKTVDVRFRWFQNSQSLGATGSVTTDDGPGGPRFVFGDQVSPEDQRRMRENTQLAMYYIHDETGLWINDFTIYFFVDRENFLDVYLEQHDIPERRRAEYRERILAIGNFWASVSRIQTGAVAGAAIYAYGEKPISLITMLHEYFHVIQIIQAQGSISPVWLSEGSAVYVQERFDDSIFVNDFAGSKAWYRTQARKTAAPLQSLETHADLRAAGVGYELGFMAVDFLVENFGSLPALVALVSFYDAIGPDTTWQDAFQSTFEISVDEFYSAFEAYRLENFPPLP